MFILETLNFVVDILKVPSVLVRFNCPDWSCGAEKSLFGCGKRHN